MVAATLNAEDRLLSVNGAHRVSGRSRHEILRAIAVGALRAIVLDGRPVLLERDLRAYIARTRRA